MTQEANLAGKHLVVDSITVLKGISGAGIKTIEHNIEMLQNAQTALAGETKDYWTSLSDDGVISPEEKKTLYKEWKALITEYAQLILSAQNYGIPASSSTLIAYKEAYSTLYTLVSTELHLFDNMTSATTLTDRIAFIASYTGYYSARDALKKTIMDGEDAKIREAAEALFEEAQKSVKTSTLSSLVRGSVEWERLLRGDTNLSLLTESGGASAFLGLSTGIPYFITASQFTAWQTALTEDAEGLAYLTQVYERVNISTTETAVYAYRFAETATEQNVKSLTNKLKALNQLKSVATIDADMLQINGTALFNGNGTIKQSAIDWSGVPAGSGLETLINALSKSTVSGNTVIDGGYIKTDLIDVAALVAKQAFIDAFNGNSASFSIRLTIPTTRPSPLSVGDIWLE